MAAEGGKFMIQSRKFPKCRTRRGRCKRVLAIFNNRLETLDLVREVSIIQPPHPDFDQDPLELAVVRFKGVLIYLPCSCLVFLQNETRKAKA